MAIVDNKSIVDNKATVRSYFQQVITRGDMSAADAIFASDIQFHYPLGDLSGADAVKDFLGAVRAAFPDIHFTIADLVGEGDRIAARWILVGTHTGELPGRHLPARG